MVLVGLTILLVIHYPHNVHAIRFFGIQEYAWALLESDRVIHDMRAKAADIVHPLSQVLRMHDLCRDVRPSHGDTYVFC